MTKEVRDEVAISNRMLPIRRAAGMVLRTATQQVRITVESIRAESLCVLCGNSSRFRTFGDPIRLRARCPICSSLERHRLQWLWLEKSGLLKAGTRVLHLAPEPCLRDRLQEVPNLNYVTADLRVSDYAVAGQVRMDVCDIWFRDSSLDLIIVNHVLEHVPDDQRAMREIRRVLKPTGTALLTIPFKRHDSTYEDWTITTPDGRKTAFGQHDHVRLYGYNDFQQRLRLAGFNVIDDTFSGTFGASDKLRYGLPSENDGALFVCTPGIPA